MMPASGSTFAAASPMAPTRSGIRGTLRRAGSSSVSAAADGGGTGVKDSEAEVWVTECPLAAKQFEQHAGKKPMHPMTVLARAYRTDGFPTKLTPPEKKEDGS